MGLAQIIKAGQDAMRQLGVQTIQFPEGYETTGRADQLYKERQGRFPDEISPIMQKLKEFYDKQPTQADIEKAANRQIALSMMGSKERNFLAGLAGGLQSGGCQEVHGSRESCDATSFIAGAVSQRKIPRRHQAR